MQARERLGRLLSLVLRHAPDKIGLTLDRNRWADVAALRAATPFSPFR